MRGLTSILLIALCIGCVEPYVPDLNLEQLNLLVVDGSIGSDGNALVTLSRSVDMDSSPLNIPYETGATVTIESSSGVTFPLIEEPEGKYRASNVDVSVDDKYTLHVKTSGAKEYSSNEVQIHETPPIDSVYWAVGSTDNTIEIRVNSKDKGTNPSGFFMWECLETYEYTAAIYSKYKFVNKRAQERLPDEDVYTCWLEAPVPSTFFDTHILTEPTISGLAVQVIPQYSKKIQVRYSILVRQRAISQEEYLFRTQLKNTTTNTGSIFSVIPGSVIGNLISVDNPGEPVLGYFRAQDLKTKRLFIRKDDLPPKFRLQKGQPCSSEETCNFIHEFVNPRNCVDIYTLSDDAVITSIKVNASNEPISYFFTTPMCGDCRAWGGTTTRPPYWVN